MVKSYKSGSLGLATAGAGDVLLFLLGPSVVSFAVSMYSRKQLLKENFLIVIASMLVSSLGALFGTAAFTRLIQLGGTSSSALMIRLSMLARNITTALAIPVTQILGGDVSIAVVVVVLTGIVGAQYGRRLLDMVGIQDPVTRGLAVGSAAQGLGVSSMVPEADAFPFAAMAMVLTAIAGTVFVSIPAIKDTLVSMCG
jgi:putative effector of murein hydrolase